MEYTDVLDEKMTSAISTFGPSDSEWLAQKGFRLMGLSHMAVTYLWVKARAVDKSPAKLVNEIVGKEIPSSDKFLYEAPYEPVYTDMTDEEYDALDEEMTRNPPKLGPDGTGWLSRREMLLMGLSHTTVNYLMTKAMAVNKSPAKLVNEMVGKEIAASSA
jgi:hypothetical protein